MVLEITILPCLGLGIEKTDGELAVENVENIFVAIGICFFKVRISA